MGKLLERVKHPQRLECAAGLLPASVISNLIWLQPPVDPITLPSLLLDRGIQAASLAALPLLLVILLAERGAALIAVTALSALGIGIASAIFLTSVLRPGGDPRIGFFSAVALGGSIVIMVRYGNRLQTVSSLPSKVVVWLVASVFSILQFWQGASFLPAQTETSMAQTVTATLVAHDETTNQVSIKYVATNGSDARALVIISSLLVCTWPAAGDIETDVDVLRSAGNCSVFRPLNDLSWVPGKQAFEWSTTMSSTVDRPRIQMVARVALARGDRFRARYFPPTDVGSLGSCSSVRTVRVDEEARFKGLAQRKKYLVYADLDGDGGRNYYLQYGDPADCSAEDPVGDQFADGQVRGGDRRLQEYFGLTETKVVSTSWLASPQSEEK